MKSIGKPVSTPRGSNEILWKTLRIHRDSLGILQPFDFLQVSRIPRTTGESPSGVFMSLGIQRDSEQIPGNP